MQAMAFGDRTRVICLAPGLMLPSGDQTDEEYARSSTLNLLRRRTSPEDLADAAVMAASGVLASGETLIVDGGQHLTPQSRDVMFLVRGET
jgi:NAD(P)-dependent dehydrogenase (short-subunit alcohol dehydrogenase family)